MCLWTRNPAVAKIGWPYRLCPKVSVRLSVAEKNDFLEWLQSQTRCGDAAISNATINARIGYGNLALRVGDACRQQLCIHKAGQTVAWLGYYWQSIESRYRPMPLPTLYDVPFRHNTCVTDKQTDRQTDGRQTTYQARPKGRRKKSKIKMTV